MVKCTEAENAAHTIADGIVWATGEGNNDARWLGLILKGDVCACAGIGTGMGTAGDEPETATRDATSGGGLAALEAADLRVTRGGILSIHYTTSAI